MKIDQEMVELIGEIVIGAEQYRPLVQQVLTTVKSFAPELKDIPEALSEYIVKNKKKIFDMHIAEGFTREESILLMINSNASLSKAMESWSKASNSINKR